MGLVVVAIETAGVVKSCLLYLASLYLNTHTKPRLNGNITQDKRCLEPIFMSLIICLKIRTDQFGEHNNYKKLKRTSNHQELN